MSIAVIGASGFLGRAIVEGLSEEFSNVLAIDKDVSNYSQPNVKFCKASIFNLETLPLEELREVKTIIYLVATSTPSTSNENIPEDIQNNLLSFIKFLEFIRELNVEKFIFASSGGAVYSEDLKPPYKEIDSLKPLTSYGINKISSEYFLNLYATNLGFTSVCLRLSNPYGPGQIPKDGFGVIPHFLNSLLKNSQITIYGGEKSKRDFVYIDDVVTAFISAVYYKGKNEIINVGSGQGLSITKLLEYLEKSVGVRADKQNKPLRPSDKKGVFLNIDKAKRLLFWEPVTSIEQGLSNYINWYKGKL